LNQLLRLSISAECNLASKSHVSEFGQKWDTILGEALLQNREDLGLLELNVVVERAEGVLELGIDTAVNLGAVPLIELYKWLI